MAEFENSGERALALSKLLGMPISEVTIVILETSMRINFGGQTLNLSGASPDIAHPDHFMSRRKLPEGQLDVDEYLAGASLAGFRVDEGVIDLQFSNKRKISAEGMTIDSSEI